MSTELVYAAASLEERKGYALALSRAGDLVPKGFRDRDGSANPGKILLAAEYGNMLQLHPMAALTGINVIDGKPTPSPALMSALVRTAGHKLRIRTTGSVEGGDIAVTVTLVRADDPGEPFTSTWTIARAKRADLWGKAGSWSKYPEAMLKWRALSEVCRDGAEDVLLGAHYVPEELGREVNEAGEMVDVTATAIDRTERRLPNFGRLSREESIAADQRDDADVVEDAEVVDEATGELLDEERPAWGDRWEPAPWEDAIADALNAEPGDRIARLRHVYRDASQRGVLKERMSNGQTLADTLTSLGKRAEQDYAAETQPEGEVS